MKTLKNLALGCAVLACSVTAAFSQSSTVAKEVIVKTTGSNGTTLQTGTQTVPLTLVLPNTAGVLDQGMIVTGVTGNTVTLGWPDLGASQVQRLRKTMTADQVLNGAAAWVTAGANSVPLSNAVLANRSYHVFVVFLITLTGPGGGVNIGTAFVSCRLNLPAGATFSGSLTGTTSNNGHSEMLAWSNAPSNTTFRTLSRQDVPGSSGTTSAVILDGYVDVAGTAGTLTVELSKDTGADPGDNFTVGTGSFMILER